MWTTSWLLGGTLTLLIGSHVILRHPDNDKHGSPAIKDGERLSAHDADEEALRGFHGGPGEFVDVLARKIRRLQVKTDSYAVPLVSWRRRKGGYMSQIHLYYHGPPRFAVQRHIPCPDNNAFVTLWVTTMLAEREMFGKTDTDKDGESLSDEQMFMALDRIHEYADKNKHHGEGIFYFWPQARNDSSGLWYPTPDNLDAAITLPQKLPYDWQRKLLQKMLSIVGLGNLVSWSAAVRVFQITPDFDDSSVNLGLGGLLKEAADRGMMKQQYQQWSSHNNKLSSFVNNLLLYSYRPSAKIPDHNTIDARSYFWLKEFLWHHHKDHNLAIATTWVSNLTETRRTGPLGVDMPFRVNNVDLTVCANVLMGVTGAVLDLPHLLEGIDSHTYDSLVRLYRNTSSLVEWAVSSGRAFARRDIALLYYPSAYNFLWMSSRIVAKLDRYTDPSLHNGRTQTLPDFIKHTQRALGHVYRTKATQWLLDQVTREPIPDGNNPNPFMPKPEKHWAYWDDFLGNGDRDVYGRPRPKCEDRIFSTAQAINTLLNIWTYPTAAPGEGKEATGKFGPLKWRSDTPAKVVSIVGESCGWLRRYTFSGAFPTGNAFFSGSMKGITTVPFFYPTNFYMAPNGTIYDVNTTHILRFLWGSTLAVSGIIPKHEYEVMVSQPHFNITTPTEFGGFNGEGTQGFPYWSSDALTFAAVLLAISRADNIMPTAARDAGHEAILYT
ncbi:unnamed protein product [Vitrella brassicaformis CCMP3155]|uniref:Glycosyl hydrolase family 63 C-terminal domain-containing protein n=2 Tax=Vitrella brassicaformis TaxID=1169539 RepID=A0A0G4H559_VITBC|nr:unnamed protein product [Vitrella brassicaformis CCMP3155]|mmetsp:Transcript_27573/g.68733  ORF Transcript_27573/g.68733 Transcript_27573/m.68733 type:complete len:720 (+) Transcript_27573:118-2277(+)|eukprot:CEM38725.1 unnamed protein product [Vitrella brassicaformis CCMP3155]